MRNVGNKRESPTKIAAIYSLSLFASWYMILHNKTIDQGHVLFFLSLKVCQIIEWSEPLRLYRPGETDNSAQSKKGKSY